MKPFAASGSLRDAHGFALVSLAVLSLATGCAAHRADDAREHTAAASAVLAAGSSARASADVTYYADHAAVPALAQAIDGRLELMRDVAAGKFLSGAPVQDEARETAVLQRVAQRAQALGLEPLAAQALFSAQMRLARAEQERWLERWRKDGRCEPCANPVSLQALRERIDASNEQQLSALYLLAPLRSQDAAELLRALQSKLPARGITETDIHELVAATAGVKRGVAGGALERTQASQALRIATTGDYAPFSLERDGQLTGADIELGRKLARHLGLQPQFVRTSWPGLLDDLRLGRFDVAISGIGFTEQRAALGLYSGAYHVGGKTLLARCSERERFDAPAKLDLAGVRVIVNPGGTNERYVREHVRQARIIVHPDNRGVFAEIAAGRADVMVTDDVEAELQARRWPGQLCRTYTGTLTQGDKRILMARDPALQAVVEQWLQGQIAAGEPARLLEQAIDDYVAAPSSH